MSHGNNRTMRRGLRISAALIATALLLAACGATTRQSASVSGGTSTSIAPGAPSLAGESKTSVPGYSGQGGVADSSAAPENAVTAPATVSPTKLVVVNKTMRIETDKVDEAIAKIRELVKRDGADISSMQVATAVDQPIYRNPEPLADGSIGQNSSAPLRAYITVRVPSANYAAFIADAAKLGRVLTESEASDDVTQQHVDMQARLGNLDAEQVRLRQLFAKATTVKDMLAVEQELTRVQGEIESMKAQIDYLERQAARATVTLELTEPVAIIQPSGIDWGVRTAFTDSVRAFVSTMNGLIVLLGPVLALLVFIGIPVLLIALLVVRGTHRHAERVAAKKAAAESETDPDRAIQAGDLDS